MTEELGRLVIEVRLTQPAAVGAAGANGDAPHLGQADAHLDTLRGQAQRLGRDLREAAHEIATLKAERDDLKRRLDKALGDLAQAAQLGAAADPDPQLLVGHPTRIAQPLHATPERQRTRDANSAVARSVVAAPIPPSAPVKTSLMAPCRVDECQGEGRVRGRWARICPDHRARLVAGETVTIQGATHELEPGPSGGRLIRSPDRPGTCSECGAKLSRYRHTGDTRCASCQGNVTEAA